MAADRPGSCPTRRHAQTGQDLGADAGNGQHQPALEKQQVTHVEPHSHPTAFTVLEATRAVQLSTPPLAFPTNPASHVHISGKQRAIVAPLLRSRLFLAAVALFISLAAILASLRLGVRTPSVLQYLRPSPLRNPFARPLTNSSMAPKQYRTPPQLPPRFTATKQSLIDDTKKLVCGRSCCSS